MTKKPHAPTGAPRELLTKESFRRLLNVSLRKFEELLAAGIVGPPLDLGPRAARWTYADYEATLVSLPRRERQPEPESLAAGRRRRIEALKDRDAR